MKSLTMKEATVAALALAIIDLDKSCEKRFVNALESDVLGYGNSSFANISKDGELFAEMGGDGYSLESVEYYEEQAQKKKKYTAAGARAILEANDQYVDMSMSDELVMLVAEQYLEDTTNIKGFASNRAEGVLVIVQYKGSDDRWYTVKNNKVKATYWYDVDTLFNKAEGSICSMKWSVGYENKIDLVNRKIVPVAKEMPTVLADMLKLGHCVNGKDGRVLLKSSSFVRGTVIEGQLIEEVPAQFYSKYVKGEGVLDIETNYAWDAIVNVCDGVAILPSESDTTQAKADEMAHDDNIIIGQAFVTTAMTSYYMDIGDTQLQAREFEEGEMIARRVKMPTLMKKYDTIAKTTSTVGELVKWIIEVSEVDAKAAINIVEEHKDQLAEIMSSLWAIKSSTGSGVTPKVFAAMKRMQDDMKAVQNKDASKKIELHVIQNIAALNKAEITVHDFTDEEIVETYEAALANYKKSPKLFNLNADVREPVRARYLAIKEVRLVAEAKAKFPVVA